MLPSDICIQAEDGIRDRNVTGVHTCALPIFIREAGSLSNDVLSAVISGFIASSALPLIEDYVDEYFAGLLGFWTDNSIEIARRLVLGLYPRWSVDEEAVVEKTDAWLAAHDDAPAALRRLIIERRDDLARAIFLKSTQSSRH